MINKIYPVNERISLKGVIHTGYIRSWIILNYGIFVNMIEIFAKCPGCGLVGKRVRQALNINPDIVVHKTGYNSPQGEVHLKYLADNGLKVSHHTDIIVDNGKVERLEAWIISHS